MSQRNMLGEVAVQEAAGVISDLLQKLGNSKGKGKKLLEDAKLLLRGELQNPLPQKEAEEPIPEWGVWQKITVGGTPWPRGLLWSLWRTRCTITKEARALLLSKAFDAYLYGDKSLQQIDLVKVTREDLGIKVNPNHAHIGSPIAEVVLAALKRGLYLCPTDVAPRLRMQYIHQPRGTQLIVMTRPLPFGRGFGIFKLLHHENEKYLPVLAVRNISCPYTNLIGGSYDEELVFCRPLPKETTKKPESGGYAI